MIRLHTGRPGSGKSLMLADDLLYVLKRNKKWHLQTKIIRKVFSNLDISDKVKKEYGEYFELWTDPAQLIDLRDADVFWDEIATHLDASQYKETPLPLKRWLQQHRKFGIEIYGTTQDFAMIDIAMRRMTSQVKYLVKLFGSRDPSPTRPLPKTIWGVVIVREISPTDYKEQEKEYSAKGFSPFLITKKRVEVFDTRQEIKIGKYPPLNHIERHCGHDECKFTRVVHM